MKPTHGALSEDLVAVPGPDGDTIYLRREEYEKIGDQGALKKYAAVCVNERQRK
jgi:hypothetical protein